MKSLILLLVAASFALSPTAVIRPGEGAAAAAVAAQNKGVPLTAHQNGTQDGDSIVMQLSGAGSILHSHGNLPGDKPFKSKVKAADVAACILGDALGCNGTIEEDAGGVAFLFFDGPSNWRIATNAAAVDATNLVGSVDGNGGFAFSGTHVLSGTSFYLTGKVKLDKTAAPAFVPLKISGKIQAVAAGQGHYGTGTFKAEPAVP
jgi:hypothetical protein